MQFICYERPVREQNEIVLKVRHCCAISMQLAFRRGFGRLTQTAVSAPQSIHRHIKMHLLPVRSSHERVIPCFGPAHCLLNYSVLICITRFPLKFAAHSCLTLLVREFSHFTQPLLGVLFTSKCNRTPGNSSWPMLSVFIPHQVEEDYI